MTLKIHEFQTTPAGERQLPNPEEDGQKLETQTQDGGANDGGHSGDDVDELRQEYEQKQEELKARYERDMNRLRSKLDSRFSREQKSWEQERSALLQRLDQIVERTMDDEAREAYEWERMNDDLARQKAELQREREELEAHRSMLEYASFFEQVGVPRDQLDLDSPEDLLQSGWMGVQNTVQSLKDEIEALKKKPAGQESLETDQKTKTKRPETFTGKGVTPAVQDPLTMVQNLLRERYGREVTPEEAFDAIDRGTIDVNQLLRGQ